MMTDSPRQIKKYPTMAILLGLIAIMPMVSGCGKAPTKPVQNATNLASSVSKTHISLNTILGSDVQLYGTETLIALPRQTPFVSLLVPEISPSSEFPFNPSETGISVPTAFAPQPEVNPFEKVSLEGIMYHSKSPMAVLTIAGRAHIIREGQVLTNTETYPASEIEVVKIDKKSVQVIALNSSSGNSVKTLVMSSLIGYGANKPTVAKTTKPSEAPITEPETPGIGNQVSSQKPFSIKDIEALPTELKNIFKNYFQSETSKAPPTENTKPVSTASLPSTSSTDVSADTGENNEVQYTDDSAKITFRPKLRQREKAVEP